MTDDYLAEVSLTHPLFADFFDELPLWSAPFGLMMLDRVPFANARTILDVGAGTGFLALELAMRSSAAHVVAVDPWQAAVDRLRRKIEYLGLASRVDAVVKDITDFDHPAASFDLAVAALLLNNLADPSAALRSIVRLLRPGGVFSAVTNLVGHMNDFYDAFRAVLIELDRADRLAALDAHIAHRGTPSSIRALLADSGLIVRRFESSAFRWRFADGRSLLRHHFIRLGFLPAWKAVIGDLSPAIFFPALERRLDAMSALRGQELALVIPTAYVEAQKPMSASA